VFCQRHKALDADPVRSIRGVDTLLVYRIDGVGIPLALALHALLAGNLTVAGGIERSAANLDLTRSLEWPTIRPFGETRDPVSLNECGTEPSANSFLPPPTRPAP
jgi:hypothetical protein